MGIHQVPPDIAQLLVDLHAGEGFPRWHRLPPNSLIPNAACPTSRLQTKLRLVRAFGGKPGFEQAVREMQSELYENTE